MSASDARSAAKDRNVQAVQQGWSESSEASVAPEGESGSRGLGSPSSAATRSRAGVLLTVLLAAAGGFGIAGGIWHKGGATTIITGCICLVVASARAMA